MGNRGGNLSNRCPKFVADAVRMWTGLVRSASRAWIALSPRGGRYWRRKRASRWASSSHLESRLDETGLPVYAQRKATTGRCADCVFLRKLFVGGAISRSTWFWTHPTHTMRLSLTHDRCLTPTTCGDPVVPIIPREDAFAEAIAQYWLPAIPHHKALLRLMPHEVCDGKDY